MILAATMPYKYCLGDTSIAATNTTISPLHHFTPSPFHPFTPSPFHPFTPSPFHYITISLHHHITTSPYHHFTISLHHHITTSPHKNMQLNGLILCGGQSSRFGTDKSQVIIDNMPQYLRIKNALLPYCQNVFISCRAEQTYLFEQEQIILDTQSAGPMSGLVSAIAHNNLCGWLLVACDWLNVSGKYIEQLCAHRNPKYKAVCYVDEQQRKQPLLSIYEPSIFDTVTTSYTQGNKSLKSVLDTANCYCLNSPLLFFNRVDDLPPNDKL